MATVGLDSFSETTYGDSCEIGFCLKNTLHLVAVVGLDSVSKHLTFGDSCVIGLCLRNLLDFVAVVGLDYVSEIPYIWWQLWDWILSKNILHVVTAVGFGLCIRNTLNLMAAVWLDSVSEHLTFGGSCGTWLSLHKKHLQFDGSCDIGFCLGNPVNDSCGTWLCLKNTLHLVSVVGLNHVSETPYILWQLWDWILSQKHLTFGGSCGIVFSLRNTLHLMVAVGFGFCLKNTWHLVSDMGLDYISETPYIWWQLYDLSLSQKYLTNGSSCGIRFCQGDFTFGGTSDLLYASYLSPRDMLENCEICG